MATGRPIRTEYDRTQNYKDYMKNLNLQIKNNKTNYDANILYKQTGVPTQPLDTRTYAEKHADIAQLKVNLRSELRVLLDDNVISEVLRELNDEQIQFLAGVAPALIAELKPKYSVGMTSHHFVDILDKKIRQEHDFSLPSEMLGTLSDQLDTIADNMVTGDKMNELIDHIVHSKYTRSDENERIVNSLRGINEDIIHTQDLLRQIGDETGGVLHNINEKILNPVDLESMIEYAGVENADRIRQVLIEQFQHIPTIAQVDKMISDIQQANAQGDRRGLDDILENVREEFAIMSDRLDTYTDNVTEAIETQRKQTAQQIATEGTRTRAKVETSVAGVYDRVEQMNENINEGITGLRTDLGNSTAGLANSLTNLYTNVGRNTTLLGDLQGGQTQIREALQSIERAVNMLQGLGEVNATQLMDIEQRIDAINDTVLRVGVKPETLEEIQGAIAILEDEIKGGFKEQKGKYSVETSAEQQRVNRERLIGDLRHYYKPYSEVAEFKTLGQMRDLLKNIYRIGDEEINRVMEIHMREPETRNFNLTAIGKLGNLNKLKNDYKALESVILEILNNPPPLPVFSEGQSTSEAVKGIYESSPRSPSESSFRTLSLRPLGELKAEREGESKSQGKGILTGHRGVGVRMTGRGVAPKEKYIPLGKYLVNIHKLEHNNIVSFKSPNLKSTNIQSKRVSQPVADILLHIVNGTLDEIVTDNLSEDDISYLFQLIKKCELENFLDGKAENKVKTKTEQEIHKFYVLQGEIVAGNDNPQLIREFKASLLTMMNEGKLSKKEAGNVLIQMSLLGI